MFSDVIFLPGPYLWIPLWISEGIGPEIIYVVGQITCLYQTHFLFSMEKRLVICMYAFDLYFYYQSQSHRAVCLQNITPVTGLYVFRISPLPHHDSSIVAILHLLNYVLMIVYNYSLSTRSMHGFINPMKVYRQRIKCKCQVGLTNEDASFCCPPCLKFLTSFCMYWVHILTCAPFLLVKKYDLPPRLITIGSIRRIFVGTPTV